MAVNEACKAVAESLGYEEMKEEQLKVVTSFVAGNDVFVVFPTGFGKSLCYACLPGVFERVLGAESVVVVLSPLTAIMRDQVAIFGEKGLSTAQITCDQEDELILSGVRDGKYQLVFFTPEMLLSSRWRGLLSTDVYKAKLRALVVDEAHTVKTWGESFRKVLLRIGELRSLVPPTVKLMALTATVTHPLLNEVKTILGMKDVVTVALSPSRPNIKYAVQMCSSLDEALQPILHGLLQLKTAYPKTIIYCRRLVDCGDVYLYFRENLGESFTEPVDAPDLPQFRLVDMYHSCTDPVVKETISDTFSSSRQNSHFRLIIATIAFGMGVDCPDVRQVIHLGPPDGTDSYIQQTGRAGRDGLQSIAVLLMVKGMRNISKEMTCYVNSKTCRRNTLFNDYEGYTPELRNHPMCCDICQSITMS